jgi:hypothetical protein
VTIKNIIDGNEVFIIHKNERIAGQNAGKFIKLDFLADLAKIAYYTSCNRVTEFDLVLRESTMQIDCCQNANSFAISIFYWELVKAFVPH